MSASILLSGILPEHGRSALVRAPAGKSIASISYQLTGAQDLVKSLYFSTPVAEARITDMQSGVYSGLIKYSDATLEQISSFEGALAPEQPTLQVVSSTESTIVAKVSTAEVGQKAIFFIVAAEQILEKEFTLTAEMEGTAGEFQLEVISTGDIPHSDLYQFIDLNVQLTSDLLAPGEEPSRSLSSFASRTFMNNLPNEPIVLDREDIGEDKEIAFAVAAPTDALAGMPVTDEYKMVFKVEYYSGAEWDTVPQPEQNLNLYPPHPPYLTHEFEKAISASQTEDLTLTRSEILAAGLGIQLGDRLTIGVKAVNAHGSTDYFGTKTVVMVKSPVEGEAYDAITPTFEISKFHSSSVEGAMECIAVVKSVANFRLTSHSKQESGLYGGQPFRYTRLVESGTGRTVLKIGSYNLEGKSSVIYTGPRSNRLPTILDWFPEAGVEVFSSTSLSVSPSYTSSFDIALDVGKFGYIPFTLWGQFPEQSYVSTVTVSNVNGYSHLDTVVPSIVVEDQFPVGQDVGGERQADFLFSFAGALMNDAQFGAPLRNTTLPVYIESGAIPYSYELEDSAFDTAPLVDNNKFAITIAASDLEHRTGKIALDTDAAKWQTILKAQLQDMTVASSHGSVSLAQPKTLDANGDIPYLAAPVVAEAAFDPAIQVPKAVADITLSAGDESLSASFVRAAGDLFNADLSSIEAVFVALDGDYSFAKTLTAEDVASGTVSQLLSQVHNGHVWRLQLTVISSHKVKPSDAEPTLSSSPMAESADAIPKGAPIIVSTSRQNGILTVQMKANGQKVLQVQGLLMDATPTASDQLAWGAGVASSAHERYAQAVLKTVANHNLSGPIVRHFAAVYAGESVDSLSVMATDTDFILQ